MAAAPAPERGDDVDQLVRIGFIDLDVEGIDAGEFFEQHHFAFHYRLAGQRADVAQAEYRAAVGDDADQVALGRVFISLGRFARDLHARRGDAWRVGQRQVFLGADALGDLDGDFAGLAGTVVGQCFLFDAVHCLSLSL
jgi:hypothetical protein